MHLNEMGAPRRPKLGLSWAGNSHKDSKAKKQQPCASSLLPNHELRRLVAEMVD